VRNLNLEIILTLDDPFMKTCCIAVLFGNLILDSCVVKQVEVLREMMTMKDRLASSTRKKRASALSMRLAQSW
jgi:dihydroxyacid dehydratase/phosphogluconate dehydratase